MKSEFLDPLVRINKMKFLTSDDIRIGSKTHLACLDIREKKSPKLTEIFKPNNPVLNLRSDQERVLVFELDLKPGQKVLESLFAGLEAY